MDTSLDDSDVKKLYQVTELQEYQEQIGFKESPSTTGTTTARQQLVTRIGPLFYLVVIVILMLVVILQAATIYIVLHSPESTTTTTSTSSAVTGDGNTYSCNQTVLLNLLNQILDNTQDIASLDDVQTLSDQLKNIESQNDVQLLYIQNNTDNYNVAQQTTLQLTSIITTLSNLQVIGISTEAIVNDIVLSIQTLLKLQNASLAQNPDSCQDIKNNEPNSTSGYYHINGQIVYCEMDALCGSDEGWTRIAYLDTSDSTVDCPDGFQLYESSGVRACGRATGGPSCESVKFDTNGVSYSEVCGRVIGYQYASPNAVHSEDDVVHNNIDSHNDINSFYVDGVSITQGYPRKHVWTLMAGLSDEHYFEHYNESLNCPCNDPPPPSGLVQSAQDFIGDDWFCESGNHGTGWSYTLYADDPLWDGDGCGSQELPCCSTHPTLPWFHKTFNSTTTDYIELRVCGDQSPGNEDTPIALYEIYVK